MIDPKHLINYQEIPRLFLANWKCLTPWHKCHSHFINCGERAELTWLGYPISLTDSVGIMLGICVNFEAMQYEFGTYRIPANRTVYSYLYLV